MKERETRPHWYQIGYITLEREEKPVYIRYCKSPRATREHKHLMRQLDAREVHGVFYRPLDLFDPEL